MKKVLTIVLVAMLTIVGQQAIAQGDGHAKGKRPEFVNEKHRAHAEWKREKEHTKKHKKHNKKKHEHHDDDRWERDDDRRRDRDDDRRVERDYPWERTTEQRRTEERRREEERRRNDDSPRTVRDIILKRTGGN